MENTTMKSLIAPATLAIGLVLGGCASSTSTYGPDGRSAYTLNCSGLARTWAMCAEKAGELCGERGYGVVASNGGHVGTVATINRYGGSAVPVIERGMLVQCR
jgi:hypothetical protein